MRVVKLIWLAGALGASVSAPVRADIYAYTAHDGSMLLSNVPDPKYTALISAPDSVVAEAPVSQLPQYPAKSRYDRLVADTARYYGLEDALLHAVISVESRYNAQAVSRAGAQGLMQLMPATARRYGVTNRFDPIQNLAGGACYLRDLLTLFNRDKRLALAAYNAGENAVVKYGNQIPPYRETVQYVPRVLAFYQRYQAEAARAASGF
ncbi:MAG: lytic transglycosylase domain-containing protein [Thiobacillaceae bacterium]